MFIKNQIDHLVNVAVTYRATVAGKKVESMDEPEITSAIVTELPSLLNRMIWPQTGIRFGGCFIHKKPKAHFKTKSGKDVSREVGDILVVCRQQIDGIETFNAALLQMKMHRGGGDHHTIKDEDEKEQLELYQNWPDFYCRRNKKDTSFNIYPKTPHPGAQYGIIEKKRGSDIVVFHATSSDNLYLQPEHSFGGLVYDFVMMQNGRAFTQRNQKEKDEWSRLIWYLLDISWLGVYKLKSLRLTDQQMISGDFFNLYQLMYSVDSEELLEKVISADNIDSNGDDVDEGIPIFFISIDDNSDKMISKYRDYIW